ncbi:hypothetical protein PtrSN002B_008638 [Pyrenophora tritici-repentis]|uniref:Uncharacterized protein n=1 Tax=Pyrenophora tritici-repentis TaxID=45151 RepID=A0A2W1D1U5_9PLEO|nr:hypothetical protein A1F94_012505 [Pyrenophora tritici-repentis]KAI1512122.1 hypothetical protein Ptr86124_008962 [Pyrenophora tritici-repentis]KAI1540608.1 hypothetical protein PtrSN002B_008638 [Pyrenophora tritici-repentis]KAI1567280.1 hypothetical protein PtrEW7m1_009286 [Pyrenophora tritici-repentis]KAI1597147.1 hypothetical protein PtrCC142_009123 [Pyrenophora tritici-repentis]
MKKISEIAQQLRDNNTTASHKHHTQRFQLINNTTTMQLPLPLPILLSLTTTTTALWIATANMDYQTATPGGAIFPSPFCQVGKGDTAEQAHSQAARTVDATAIIAGGHCDQLPYQHTNQLGGFWDDYGTVFYVDGDWQWYCNPGTSSSGYCDAGDGAPRKKRSVGFEG